MADQETGETLDIYIGPNGRVTFIHDDRLAEAFDGETALRTKRASHVEPCGTGWKADMSPLGGPLLMADIEWFVPFKTRAAALAAERAWIAEWLENGGQRG